MKPILRKVSYLSGGLWALLLIFSTGLPPAWGVELKDMMAQDNKAPVNITADHLEADNKAHQITFSGNVVAKREEALLYADKMIVYLNEKMDTMTEIHAVGNVRVNQKDRFATGDKGVYNDAKQLVTLTGNPKIWQGDNVVTGEVIEFDMKEEKARALPGENRRVTCVINPGKGGLLPGGGSADKPAEKKETKTAPKEDKAGKSETKTSAKETKTAKKADKEAKEVKEMINVNRATKEELKIKFPELEEKKIERLIENRPYKAPMDLVKKGVLNQKEWDSMKDYIAIK